MRVPCPAKMLPLLTYRTNALSIARRAALIFGGFFPIFKSNARRKIAIPVLIVVHYFISVAERLSSGEEPQSKLKFPSNYPIDIANE